MNTILQAVFNLRKATMVLVKAVAVMEKVFKECPGWVDICGPIYEISNLSSKMWYERSSFNVG